jgi:hypothetical protein
MISLDVLRLTLLLDEAEHPVLRYRLAGGAYGQVDGLPDTAGGQAYVAMEIVGVPVSQPSGHGLGLAGE